MYLKKVIAPLIKAHKAGLALTTNQLESHYLAGGNVDRVVDANIAAQRADIDLPFERAAAIDLAGRDVLEAVQMSVNPKVIETPFIAGVAMNGIEVKAKARITVRAILLDLLVVLVKKQSSHVLVKVSFQQLVLVSITQKYLKTQIIFLKQY